MGCVVLLCIDIVVQIVQGYEVVDVLICEVVVLSVSLEVDVLFVGIDDCVCCYGNVDEVWVVVLVVQMQVQLVVLVYFNQMYDLLLVSGECYCGVLGLCFDEFCVGWLVLLWCEQIEMICWGGWFEKEIVYGLLGLCLMLCGFFVEWCEIVCGIVIFWVVYQLESVLLLLDVVSCVYVGCVLEVDCLCFQFWVVLGYDLCDLLNMLSVVFYVLDQQKLLMWFNVIICNLINWMVCLLCDLQDIICIQNGFGLVMEVEEIDLVVLLM